MNNDCTTGGMSIWQKYNLRHTMCTPDWIKGQTAPSRCFQSSWLISALVEVGWPLLGITWGQQTTWTSNWPDTKESPSANLFAIPLILLDGRRGARANPSGHYTLEQPGGKPVQSQGEHTNSIQKVSVEFIWICVAVRFFTGLLGRDKFHLKQNGYELDCRATTGAGKKSPVNPVCMHSHRCVGTS